MKYALDYRNMHTAIHGLLLFDTRKQAEKAYEILRVDNQPETISMVLEDLHSYVEEVDYRKLTEVMKAFCYHVNDNGRVHTIQNNVRIVNYRRSIDLYI